MPNWSSEEYQALVSFLLLYTSGLSWSSSARKDTKFWAEAGVFVQQQTKSLILSLIPDTVVQVLS